MLEDVYLLLEVVYILHLTAMVPLDLVLGLHLLTEDGVLRLNDVHLDDGARGFLLRLDYFDLATVVLNLGDDVDENGL